MSGGAGGDGSYGPWGLSGVSGEVEATTWVVVALQFAVCASPPPPGLEAMDAAREEGAPFSIASVTAASCLVNCAAMDWIISMQRSSTALSPGEAADIGGGTLAKGANEWTGTLRASGRLPSREERGDWGTTEAIGL